MRYFHIDGERFSELPDLPETLPARGFIWAGYARSEFAGGLAEVQAALARWNCGPIVDLHVSDLLNETLPSQFDTTSWYDLLVFHRLAAAPGQADDVAGAIETHPVGFALFDRVLVTVHPGDCAVRDFFANRLGRLTEGREARGSARLPASPADLMLRMANHMVDSYLDLRRLLSRQFAGLQKQLLDPHSQFDNWPLLLNSREALHRVEDICEDQRSAVQEWIDALDEWPLSAEPAVQRERELLRVRSRDLLEHVERVLSHVRRLESSAESTVQMHFSALGHRTNSIMRTLTVLTAIFLPLNLITGIFGMNFDALPLIHRATGFWIAVALMVALGLGLGLLFWRKRYLSSRQ
jgi:Mg2+ and Co2+ transporter CorA